MPTNKETTKLTADTAEIISRDCLAVRARLLNRTITGIFDDALRPAGLTAGQLNILVVLARLGPISPTGVAQRLNMDKSTVSRNIERMRKPGWISVSAGESGRGQALELRKKGRDLLQKSLPLWEQAQRQATELLGKRSSKSIHAAGDTVWLQIRNR